MGLAARAGAGGGLSPRTAAIIGYSPAPLGASPLISMATPLLSKQKGASFYEIFKPNFAVWVHTQSRGPGDTRDQARQWEAVPRPLGGPSHPPDLSNTHCGLQPLPALKHLPVLCLHRPHPVLTLVPSASPFTLSPISLASAAPRARPLWLLGLRP